MSKEVKVGDMTIGAGAPLALIAGPCVIESEERTLKIAERLKEITSRLEIPFIFKASYDKANRSSLSSFRGPGLREGLRILSKVKRRFGFPILSDVHCTDEVEEAAEVLDLLQIPAFLCRQTDLIQSAAKTGKVINVKKGQFLAPADVKNIAEKIEATGNQQVLFTERGSCFGYNNLVVDMRAIPLIQNLGYPVIFDATHSVQRPGGLGNRSGGDREFVKPLARAAVAAGADGIFLEVHDKPDEALCDGPNMLELSTLEPLLEQLLKIRRAIEK